MRYLTAVFCLLAMLLVPAAPALALATSPEVKESAAPSQPGGVGIRLLDIPAATQTDPRARSYIVDRLAPGAAIQRRIEVSNSSDTAQSVRVYAGAAELKDGAFVGGNDPAENELTSWISFDKPQIDLVPGESAEVMVSINVAADAPEAEQYAVIWAEVRGDLQEGSNIVQASRAGIRVYLSVGEGNGKPADFRIESLIASRSADGRPQVSVSVTNTGGRALDLTGQLALTEGPAGLSAGPFAAQQTTTLAPGATGQVMTLLDAELPNGPWNAELTLKSGLVENSVNATITFPESGEGKAIEVDDPAFPLVPMGIAVLILVAVAIWWTLRRRKTARTREA